MIDAYIVTLPQPLRPTLLCERIVIPHARNSEIFPQKSIRLKILEENLRIFYSSSITHDTLSSLGEVRTSSQSAPSSKIVVAFAPKPHCVFIFFLSVLYLIV